MDLLLWVPSNKYNKHFKIIKNVKMDSRTEENGVQKLEI